MNAPTIAQIKSISPPSETLWNFLSALPSSFEAQVFYALFLSGVAGSFSSWLWKWSNNQAGMTHYTVKYTIAQALWLAGSAIAAITTVGFSTESGEFFGWLSVLWTGALAGFGGEVKNERLVWTNQRRKLEIPKAP